jgi:uncharacterized membrane protein HdeD (DUF308 family)
MSTFHAAITNQLPRWSILWAVVLIILGLLAIGLPLATSFDVVLVIGWLLVLSGGTQALHAFQSKGIGSILWKLVVALLYFGAGMFFLAHPLLGIASLTLAIGIFFLAEAAMDFVMYFKARKSLGSGWILFDGIGTLILGLLIWRQWPGSSTWAIGTLVGISILMTGITRLMITLAARSLSDAHAG